MPTQFYVSYACVRNVSLFDSVTRHISSVSVSDISMLKFDYLYIKEFERAQDWNLKFSAFNSVYIIDYVKRCRKQNQIAKS